jgi:hypothetical protein
MFDWKPAPFFVIKNDELRRSVETDGFAIVDLLSQEKVDALRDIYAQEHQVQDRKGGMFYSVYSQDTAYRKRIHLDMQALLKPSFEDLFSDYSNAINFFINKVSGNQSGFSLHQDSSAVDEFNHSVLSLWIPLQDVDESNGALWLIEKTQFMFSPYRSVSFPFPFAKIKDTLQRYLQPIPLKTGQALVFDNRIVHTSGQNSSGSDRIAVVSGILPQQAEFQFAYQASPEDPIELYGQEKDFLVNYPNFFHNCTDRPQIGVRLGEAPFVFPEVSKEKFEKDCLSLGIPERNLFRSITEQTNFITEPQIVEVTDRKRSFFEKLFS